jgi:serine/threonine-protein kinase
MERQGGGLEAGERLGHFRVEAFLGQGAMGVVYLAEHLRLGRRVALKVLKPELSGSELFRKRFVREARVAAQVEHENLVPIVEAGEADGRYYLAAAYIPGRTLDQRLGEGPLQLEELLRIMAEVGAGLDALHQQGLVHRDVKPSNILLDEGGKALLTDFGLTTGQAYTVLTKPGQVVGTLDYLAPELIKGETARPASDVYALGCVAFACVAGAPPFAGKSAFEVTVAHLDEEPPDPCASRPELPASLSAAVLEALAKDPEARPRSARAFALSLWLAARPRR